ncbi:MAG: TylF/MycF/NovP-related O-methyltransferase [Acidimicrobiales bacterium]
MLGQDLLRRGAKEAQWWLRTDRRHERLLRRARLQGPQTRYSHELIVPMTSTYAPWHDDSAFRRSYDAIAGHTFVDQYKCYELWEQLGQLGAVAGDVLEVGVWRGGTGVLMARRVRELGFDARIHLCDTFSGVAKAGPADPWYRGGEHADTSPEIVRNLATAEEVEVAVLVGMFPEDTAHLLEDCSFRLVHIDVDVYDSARDTLEWVWPRLNAGGVVIWDDYGAFECEGVATLGRELFASNLASGRLVHNVNGHLLLIKLASEPLPELTSLR